jgi:hypothetical protein
MYIPTWNVFFVLTHLTFSTLSTLGVCACVRACVRACMCVCHNTRCAKIRPATSTWCTLGNANVGGKRHFSEKCTVKNVFLRSVVTRLKKIVGKF